MFVWREDDASIKREMLAQKGVSWDDYPRFFQRGTYLQRRTHERALTDDERARIPEAHRPPVRRIANLAAVLFERADPVARDNA